MSNKAAYVQLYKDPVLKQVIETTGKLAPLPPIDPYRGLLKSIVSQQLSTKAADTIYSRFLDLYPRKNPGPKRVLETEISDLRNAGLSNAKSGYIKNVAQFSIEGHLKRSVLSRMDDPELVEHLTQIKGVGNWTAEMIAMFSMKSEYIFPIDDMGIMNTIIQ